MCLAVPGQLLTIEGDDPLSRMGKVSFGGVVKAVNLAYLPDAQVGDYVVVHVGFAISKLEEEEAQKVFDYIREIEELDEPGGDPGPDRPAALEESGKIEGPGEEAT